MKIINSEKNIKKPLVWLEINRKNLLANVATLQRLIGETKLMAVLKANAYGLGVVGVAKTIDPKVDAFGVVGVKDALLMRANGISKPIINLGIYSSDDAASFIKNKINPTIFTYAAFNDLANKAKKLKKIIGVWIKIDTGLDRLGIPYNIALEFIKKVAKAKNVKIAGIYSALTEDNNFDKIQLQRFLKLKNECQKLGLSIPLWSLASSDAIFLSSESTFDLARPGIILFGFYPSRTAQAISKIKLRPVVTFKTRIAAIKELESGESVFYRRRFVAEKKTRIAILLAGYSYGLDSRLVSGALVLIGGRRYPLVGGIAMTNCFVNIGNNKNIKAGDEVVIFGQQNKQVIKLEEICALLQQNEYEFLSRIPEKVERIYK